MKTTIQKNTLFHNLNIIFLNFKQNLYDSNEIFIESLKTLIKELSIFPRTNLVAKAITKRLISIFIGRPIYNIFNSNEQKFIEINFKSNEWIDPNSPLISSFSRNNIGQNYNIDLKHSLETFHKIQIYDLHDLYNSNIILADISPYNITFILNLFEILDLNTEYLQ